MFATLKPNIYTLVSFGHFPCYSNLNNVSEPLIRLGFIRALHFRVGISRVFFIIHKAVFRSHTIPYDWSRFRSVSSCIANSFSRWNELFSRILLNQFRDKRNWFHFSRECLLDTWCARRFVTERGFFGVEIQFGKPVRYLKIN